MFKAKDLVISAIKKLPENASYEDIMEIIYVQQKIAVGLQQTEEGNLTTDEDFKQEISLHQISRQKIIKF